EDHCLSVSGSVAGRGQGRSGTGSPRFLPALAGELRRPRQADAGTQTARLPRTEFERTAMADQRPAGYRQTQPVTAVRRLAGDPREGLAQARKPLLRHAGPLVSDGHDTFLALA